MDTEKKTLEWSEVSKEHGLIVAVPCGWEELTNPAYILAPQEHRKLWAGKECFYSPSVNVLLMGDGTFHPITFTEIKASVQLVYTRLDRFKLIEEKTAFLSDRYGTICQFEYNRGEHRFLAFRSTFFFAKNFRLVSAEFSGEISDMYQYDPADINSFLQTFRVEK